MRIGNLARRVIMPPPTFADNYAKRCPHYCGAPCSPRSWRVGAAAANRKSPLNFAEKDTYQIPDGDWSGRSARPLRQRRGIAGERTKTSILLSLTRSNKNWCFWRFGWHFWRFGMLVGFGALVYRFWRFRWCFWSFWCFR